ncbi:Spy/CpxP family protein refolding chaperone [Geomonas sp. RF6]|uniref:Spy/CpxP family protein refolding chaperone n=1 Tax=Geomonas sp. RF6 TaxID=2897342 RepID=UPI001E2FECFB|nr:Spy/CpxP family protein refolding chaperone [Geomonas sp. RF6]UFS72759.1 Spy/CpxP family protein refolding chaperone [Geomonas sp. RF6]
MKRSVATMIVAAGFSSMIALGGVASANEPAARPAHGPEEGGRFGDCRFEKGKGGEHFLKRLTKELNLNEKQAAQVKGAFEKKHATMKPLLDNLRNERQQLRTLIHSGNADEKAIRAQSARVAAVEADLAVLKGQGAKELMSILTPEQQKKFKTLQGEWEQKMKNRHHEGPRHGGHEGF